MTTTQLVCCWVLLCVIHVGCVPAAGLRSCRNINAGISLQVEGVTYFFSDTRYLEYDEGSGVERRTGTLSTIGLDGVPRIDAIAWVPGADNQVMVFSGERLYRYNVRDGEFQHLGTQGGLSEDLGLPSGVDAAFGVSRQVTVAKGCDLWTMSQDKSGRFQKENRTLADLGLPCDLDTAVTWSDEQKIVFIKGHVMWKLPYGNTGDFDEVEGPFHTDDLNICSWFLCGEANFTRPSDDVTSCNGDPRLCPLRLDQVTLPGLHNAGAGFAHGFGMLNCWVKNHGLSIYDQLKLGIRHLDIDPCYDRCGYLGTCHSYFCGGSLCSMIKQIRRFLLQYPDEVLTVNFNHEILEPRKVFRELTRQLKAQLRPMLSSSFRDSSQIQWPTLHDSIRHNKRVFIIYAYIIQNEPYARYYRRNNWIHTEHWLGSTWREIELTSGCTQLIPATQRMCYHRQHRQLVEVSTVLTPSFSTCISDVADACRHQLVDTLKACQNYRYRHGKSPNILLVDYPEVNPQAVTSVFHAVYLQNVRNVLQHRPTQCQITIGAAAMVSNKGVLFSGRKVVTFDFDLEIQTEIRDLPEELHDVEAAYGIESHQNDITVIKDGFMWQVDTTTFSNTTRKLSLVSDRYSNPAIDGAVFWNNSLHLFHGCSALRVHDNSTIALNTWGIPCDVDAVMTSQDGASLHAFKDDLYWTYPVGDGSHEVRQIKAWDADLVRCGG